MTLAECKLGEKVIVEEIQIDGKMKNRFLELGLTPGTVVAISNIAPFGDPIAINLRGFKLSFRKEEAKNIKIKKI